MHSCSVRKCACGRGKSLAHWYDDSVPADWLDALEILDAKLACRRDRNERMRGKRLWLHWAISGAIREAAAQIVDLIDRSVSVELDGE